MSRRHRRLLPHPTVDDLRPPAIPPVSVSGARPWISVMIPTFNCAALLRACLAGVLAQDLGPSLMEIVVVDDRSELDDPEAVVDELVGAVATFNDCVRRSTGELVHVLHGDDLVLGGFYEEVRRLARSAPESSLYATGFTYIDERGRTIIGSRPIEGLSTTEAFAVDNPLQFCACVMRRSALEATGGFTPTLVHAADLEMWARLSARFGLTVSPRALASYRLFDAQHSAALRRTAENLVDHERALAILDHHRDLATSDLHLRRLRDGARRQADQFRDLGDADAEGANDAYWSARATLGERIRRRLGVLRRTLTSGGG